MEWRRHQGWNLPDGVMCSCELSGGLRPKWITYMAFCKWSNATEGESHGPRGASDNNMSFGVGVGSGPGTTYVYED